MGKRKSNSAHVLIWIVIMTIALHDVRAALKTTFLEDLCYMQKSAVVNLRYSPTGILMSLPQSESLQSFECEVVLTPPEDASVVLSIFRFDVSPDDLLTIEDSDRFKVALAGYGNYKDEKKAFISEGRMVIRYRRNTTESSHSRQGFQFTYTSAQRVLGKRCYDNEFQCGNRLCILKEYVCDGHNHCGDGSDQKKCVPNDESISKSNQDTKSYRNYSSSNIIWISIIGAAGAVVFIIVIVFIVVVIRRSKTKNSPSPAATTNNQNGGGNIPLQSVSSTVPQQQSAAPTTDALPSAPPAPEGFSFYNRVRRSLRGMKSPKTEDLPKETIPSEVYQVPSMYPNLDQHEPMSSEGGIENPEFKIDE